MLFLNVERSPDLIQNVSALGTPHLGVSGTASFFCDLSVHGVSWALFAASLSLWTVSDFF